MKTWLIKFNTAIYAFIALALLAPLSAFAWDPIGDMANPGRILVNTEREMRAAVSEAQRITTEGAVQAGGQTLALWLQQSRDSALRGSIMPIPARIRDKMKPFYDSDVLDRVRFKVGDAGVLNLGNLSIQYGGANGVTLVDVIVFSNESDTQNEVLWAHELKHIEQFRDWGVQNFAVRYVRSYSAVEDEAYAAANTYKAWVNSGLSQYTYTPMYPTPNKFYFVRANVSGLFLDVYGGDKTVGANVVQALPHKDQLWQLVPSETAGYYYIQSKVSGLYLDVLGGNQEVGGEVVQAAKHPSQVWRLVPARKPGYFHIQSKVSGLDLDVYGAAQTVGANVVQANRHDSQVWGFCLP